MENQNNPSNTNVYAATACRFLRLPAVCQMTGLSRSQIYRLQAEGQFPKSVKLGVSASAWIESEITQWQAGRVAASREVQR